MDFEKLLPVGSVVRLQGAGKKIVIMGIMQMKKTDSGLRVYDYIGVPFPEGFLGPDSGLLFNHDTIEEVIFTGYQNLERERFVQTMQTVLRSGDQTIQSALQAREKPAVS